MTVNIIHIVVFRRLHEVNRDSRGPVTDGQSEFVRYVCVNCRILLLDGVICVQKEPDVLEKIRCCRILTKSFHEGDVSLTT